MDFYHEGELTEINFSDFWAPSIGNRSQVTGNIYLNRPIELLPYFKK